MRHHGRSSSSEVDWLGRGNTDAGAKDGVEGQEGCTTDRRNTRFLSPLVPSKSDGQPYASARGAIGREETKEIGLGSNPGEGAWKKGQMPGK